MRTAMIALFGVLAAIFLLGLAVPLASVVWVSLTGMGGSGGTPNLDTYQKVFASNYYMRALAETVLFCLATSLIATAWAVPLAWRIGTQGRAARWLRPLCQVNFAFAGATYGMLMIVLMGNAGMLALAERALFGTEAMRGLGFTALGLGITYLSFQIPRSALIMAEAVAKIDPALLSAARTLGASGPAVTSLVVLPLLRPALVEAGVFSFLLAVASFGPALLLARSITIFPVVIFREFTGFLEFGIAAAMSMILLAVGLGIAATLRAVAGRPAAATH